MQSVARHFLKARQSYAKAAIVQNMMRNELVREISAKRNKFERIFEFGAGQDELGQLLRKKIKFKEYIASDINGYDLNENGVKFIKLDMNAKLPNNLGKFNLITSNACLQWLNVKTTFENIQHILAPNALIAISSFNEKNLWQTKELTGFGLKYPSIDEIEQACKNLKNVKIHTQTIKLKFNSSLELFSHLKQSGVNSLGKIYLSKSLLKRCEVEFKNTITYEPLYIIANA